MKWYLVCCSGAFLEDAMVLLCGHSFGGLMLKKVIEMVFFQKTSYSGFQMAINSLVVTYEGKVLSFTVDCTLQCTSFN